MIRARFLALVLLVALSPAMVSCWPFRRARPPAQPAPQPPPAEAPVETTPEPIQPVELPPPDLELEPRERLEPGLEPKLEPLPSPPPKRPSPAGPPVAGPEPPAPEPTPAPPPQLRQILTPEQTRELNQAITTRLDSARSVLAALDGRSLSREQATSVIQIETFIHQAEDARKTDLVRANNLAERADVLARDLMRRLR